MSGLLYIGASDMSGTDQLTRVTGALTEMFSDLAAGVTASPSRTVVEHGPDRQLLAGASIWERRGVGSVKVTTLTPDNPARGLPLIYGVVVLTDLATGQIRALLEGAELTALRTSAVAALATRLWAPPDADELAIVGAGVQAHALVRAMSAVRPWIRTVRVCSRARERAEAFAAWIHHTEGHQVAVCESPKETVRDAPIICTATSTASVTPIVLADWIAPGAHVNIIGGIHEDAVEVEPSLLSDAHVVVEQRQVAVEDAGEVRTALTAGMIRVEDLYELGTAAAPDGRTTVFRSVGMAIEDTAAAVALYEGTVR